MTIRHRTVPAGTPAGTVSLGKDDAGQIVLLLSDASGQALEAALTNREAASLGWHLVYLAEPKSAAGASAARAFDQRSAERGGVAESSST